VVTFGAVRGRNFSTGTRRGRTQGNPVAATTIQAVFDHLLQPPNSEQLCPLSSSALGRAMTALHTHLLLSVKIRGSQPAQPAS
jgi:hypothetical protein